MRVKVKEGENGNESNSATKGVKPPIGEGEPRGVSLSLMYRLVGGHAGQRLATSVRSVGVDIPPLQKHLYDPSMPLADATKSGVSP